MMYKCRCCAHKTLPVPPEDAVGFICPICFWENDVFTDGDDEHSDENRGLTLNEGRKNFVRYGICDPRLKEPCEIVPNEGTIPQNTASGQIIGGRCRYKPSTKGELENK